MILTLSSDSKRDLQIIKEIALKFGMKIEETPRVSKKTISKKKDWDKILNLAAELDSSTKQNAIEMQEVVEECRIVRKQRYAKE